MNYDEPIRLKPEDSPAPDLQALGIQLMAALRTLTDDAEDVVKTLRTWDVDPLASHRRAQGRAIEVSEAARSALALAQELMQGIRRARLVSDPYGRGAGGRDGR